jgi:hypothetical protein
MTKDVALRLDTLRAEVAAEEARIDAMVRSGTPHCFVRRARSHASDLRIRAAGLSIMLEILAERAAPSSRRRGAAARRMTRKARFHLPLGA